MGFQLPSLLEPANPSTLVCGLRPYREKKAQTLTVTPAPNGAAEVWLSSGDVQGSRRTPYQVKVDLHLMPDGQTVDRWRGHCTSPVGTQCKHALALLNKAAYQSERMAAGLPGSNAPGLTSAARAQQAAAREYPRKQAGHHRRQVTGGITNRHPERAAEPTPGVLRSSPCENRGRRQAGAAHADTGRRAAHCAALAAHLHA